MGILKISATAAYALAVATTLQASRGCCTPEGQIELIATVLDGPTNQIISTPSFVGDAKYAQCNVYYGQNGAGGGSQSGPCERWIVYSPDEGGEIVVTAKGYEPQRYEVPKADDSACGTPDRPSHTFHMVRSPTP